MNKFLSLKLLSLLSVCALLTSCSSFFADKNAVPFKSDKENSWGIITEDGEVLVDDEFEHKPTITSGNYTFVQNSKGFFELFKIEDRKAKQVGDEYKGVSRFVDDAAIILDKNNTLCIINREGEIVKALANIEHKKVVGATAFNKEGFSILELDDEDSNVFCVINTNGTVLIPAKYGNIGNIEGKNFLCISKKDIKNLKDATILIIEADGKNEVKGRIKMSKYSDVSFNELFIGSEYVFGGLQDNICVEIEKNGEKLPAIIDFEGNYILKPKSRVRGYSQVIGNVVVFKSDEGKYGAMTKDGATLIRAKYDQMGAVNGGNTFVVRDGNSMKLINQDDEQLGQETFSNCSIISDNVVAGEISANDWALLDASTGKIINEGNKATYIYCICDIFEALGGSNRIQIAVHESDEDEPDEFELEEELDSCEESECGDIDKYDLGEELSISNDIDDMYSAAEKEVAKAAADIEKEVAKATADIEKEVAKANSNQLNQYSWLSARKLTESDISGLSSSELRILRNMIYAQHGYIFKSEDLKVYFSQFSWYKPITSNVTLNSTELYNVDFIKRHE